jgi:hypothetical protein
MPSIPIKPLKFGQNLVFLGRVEKDKYGLLKAVRIYKSFRQF